MKPESLEALMIDRALGQLTPETEELLAEYLADNPEVAPVLDEWDGTVDLAAKALRSHAPRLVVPPPKFAAVPHPWKARVLGLAASFLVGVAFALLGLKRLAPTNPPQLAAPATPAPVIQPAPTPTDSRIRTMPFWSTERAVALAATRQNPSNNQ